MKKYKNKIVVGLLVGVFILSIGIVYLLLSIFSSHITGCNVNKGVNFNFSKMIIVSLERYKTDFGEYPSNLTLLVPAYMTNISKTIQGADFKYYTTKKKYALSFPDCAFVNCVYDSENKNWVCDD